MAKTPTVSKKELADSGFTNLRDYLNDKRGLTRKGSPMAIKRADAVDSESREGRRRGPADDMSGRDSLDKQMSESALDMSMAQRDGDSASKFLRAGESNNSRGSSKYRESGQAMVNKQDEDAAEMRRESRRSAPSVSLKSSLSDEEQAMKRGGKVKKMASGGSVSSASSRGDGIAQRGKTRGKMC
jgi:hypothetical protein